LSDVKQLAKEYYRLTGKPLGVTGEVAEHEAARLLGLELAKAQQDGYDAIEVKAGRKRRLQIKGRRLLPNSKPGQRIGSIRIEKKFDAVLLVLMDEDFDAVEIWEASHAAVAKALTDPPVSKARNEWHALGVDRFKSVGSKKRLTYLVSGC
jgi:hypothetical protein